MTLRDWSSSTLQSLIGRREGRRLEFKSREIDLTKDSDREKLAEEIAAFSTVDGGYLVIGTDDGESPTAMPGFVELTDETIEALRRSILDRVRPSPFVSGPTRIQGDEGDLLVIQIHSHPSGLPVGTGQHRFFVRVEDESKKMPVEDVIRQTIDYARSTQSARARAEQFLEQLRAGFDRRNTTPTGIVLTPGFKIDEGLTGSQLAILVTAAAKRYDDEWAEFDPGATKLPGATMRSIGVDLQGANWLLTVTHQGDVGVVVNQYRVWGDSPDGHDVLDMARDLCRFLGLVAAIQARAVGRLGRNALLIDSGGIGKLQRTTSTGPMSTISSSIELRPDDIPFRVEREVDVLRADIGEQLGQALELFFVRLLEGAKHHQDWNIGLETYRDFLRNAIEY